MRYKWTDESGMSFWLEFDGDRTINGNPGHFNSNMEVLRLASLVQELEAEQDRLRALVVRMREALEVRRRQVREEIERLFLKAMLFPVNCAPLNQILADLNAIISDPDGQAAEAWLRERVEKAAEPWKALAGRMHLALESEAAAREGMGRGLADTELANLIHDHNAKAAAAWLASRLAQAREEGKSEERAKGAEVPPAGARDGNQ